MTYSPDRSATRIREQIGSQVRRRSGAIPTMCMDGVTTTRLYDLWSKVYDWTFGVLVAKRQARAVAQMRLKPGDHVLDIGVGTGMTLTHYPSGVTVVGLDLSEGMLAHAAEKCRQFGLSNCHLVRGDAMQPPLAAASFNHVIISHTISVVSNPAMVLNWASRLLKPGGRIVLLNHFQSTHPVMAWFEKVLNPLFMKIGWRSDLAMEEVLRGSGLHVEYCFKTVWADIWRIVVLNPETSEINRPADATAASIPPGELAIGYGQ